MAITPLLQVVTHPVQTLAAGGTAQPLNSAELAVEALIIYAPTSNSGTCYIGGSTVDSANGIPLEPGEHWPIGSDRELGATADIDLNTIYWDGTTSDTLRVMYYQRDV